MMISSDRREMSTPVMAATNANSATRSRAAVHRWSCRSRGVAELAPRPFRSRPSVLPASAPEPYGEALMRLSQSVSRCVANQRPSVGHELVREQHGLGVLHVGAARHHGAAGLFALLDQGALTRSSRSPAITRGVTAQPTCESGRRSGRCGTAGPELAAEFIAGNVNQTAFEGGGLVLIVFDGAKEPSSTWRWSVSSASSMRCSSSAVRSPARPRARAWAREPAMSSSAKRQSNCVDLDSRASSGDGPDVSDHPTGPDVRCSQS